MAQDQNKKTLRHFQCRDYLWDIFEQMSAELECSTDYLINESMRQYARSRNYGTNRSSPSEQPPAPRPAAASAPAIPSLRGATGPRASTAGPPTRPITRTATPAAAATRPATRSSSGSLPPPPPPMRASTTGMQAPTAPARPASPSVASMAPPPLPGGGRNQSQAAVPAKRMTLFVVFNGQKIPVNKDEFVIGRGAKSADLPIKDGNISRRHAAVVFQNGAYFMKDLGSTNGIEFDGRRVDTRRIEDGDLYRICDYELRFTYR